MSSQQSSHRSSRSLQRRHSHERLPPPRVSGSVCGPGLTPTSQTHVVPQHQSLSSPTGPLPRPDQQYHSTGDLYQSQQYYHVMAPSLRPYQGAQSSHMGSIPAQYHGALSFPIWDPSQLRHDGPSSFSTGVIPHSQLHHYRPLTSATAVLPSHPEGHQAQPSTSAPINSPDLSQSDDDDNEDLSPIDDPGVRKGRGISSGKLILQDDRAKRVPLLAYEYGGFSPEVANTIISYLIRINFDLNYLYWDDFNSEHKDKLWNQFGRYFQWESDQEAIIWNKFNEIGRLRFIKALNKAKEAYKNGRRVKWLDLPKLKKLVRHWRKPEVMIVSDRSAKNRGVRINEEGKKEPAKATHFGHIPYLNNHYHL